MDGRKSLGILGFSGGALVLGLLAACSAPAPETTRGTSQSVSDRPFDRNAVLDDRSMRDPDAMTVADVQKFLDRTPWGKKSALATYKENGKTAAAIMVDAARSHGINPLEMLVRVQMEQGLISKTTATTASIGIAFGCGCPHSNACSDRYRGFTNQADCAAGTLRRSMDRALTSTGTASGWARNKTKTTEDGMAIVPKNAVTAALYTYTPWVGEAGGGKQGVGGVSLHAQVWDRFAEAASYGEWAVQGTGEDAGGEQPADPVAEADAGVEDPAEADGGVEEPAPDAGSSDPQPEPGSSPDGGADGGAPRDLPGAEPGGGSGSQGAPEDGSEDDAILSEGSSPPASNAPPPRTRNRTPSRPEELPEASEEELAVKQKAGAGCSTSGHPGGSSNGLLIAGAAALALIGARRARRAS